VAWDAVSGLKEMTARYVVPVLREKRYRGSVRKFTLREGDLSATIQYLLSRWNTASSKEFTFELKVSRNDKTIWASRIGHVMPTRSDYWYKVESDADLDSTGARVSADLAGYACVAVQVVMEDPNPNRVPKDPRTFPKEDPDYGLSIEDRQEAEARWWRAVAEADEWEFEECISKANDSWLGYRRLAQHQLREKWPDEPESVDAFRKAIESENSWRTREFLVLSLGFWPGLQRPAIDAALADAAELDENAHVRWAAKYATAIRSRPTET
jgi:hypothetical protein